jgi:hypothetical protein
MGEGLDELIPVESVARVIDVLGNLDTIGGLIQTADRIHASFPRAVRDNLVCGDCREDGLDSHSSAKVSIALAQLSPEVRREIARMVEDVRRFISEDEESAEIDENCLQLISELLTFAQGVGSRSVRYMLDFFRSANEGDFGYLLVQSGIKNEIRSARRVSERTREEFGL